MEKRKNLPEWALMILDLLLTAAILLTFAYFHHVRMFTGKDEEEEPVMIFTQKASSSVTEKEGVEPVKYEGMFGESFPGVFSADNVSVTLEGNSEILTYAIENDLPFVQRDDLVYNSLYRSHDLFVTVYEVNTEYYDRTRRKNYHVQYFVYDVYIRNIDNLITAYADPRIDMSDLIDDAAERLGGSVIAAVNGDYMGNRNHCLVSERNGELFRESDYILSDICVLYYDGTVETYTPKEYDFDAIAEKSPYQIWNFGPELLDKDGSVKSKYDSSSYDNNIIDSRHPRTALGYYEPGHYCFVSVDGRSDDSNGVTIPQLASIMKDMGCVKAYNLDGGDSSQAYFMGGYIRIDEDRSEQRKLFDIICIGEVGKNEEEKDK